MTAVFHAWPYGRFIEIQSNLRRKKLHRTNQAPIFLEAVLAIEMMMSEPQSNLEEKVNHSILKYYFFSRTDPSIFKSILPVFLDWSIETSWVFPALESTSHYLPQSTVSCRSDISSEANPSSCHRSDAANQILLFWCIMQFIMPWTNHILQFL